MDIPANRRFLARKRAPRIASIHREITGVGVPNVDPGEWGVRLGACSNNTAPARSTTRAPVSPPEEASSRTPSPEACSWSATSVARPVIAPSSAACGRWRDDVIRPQCPGRPDAFGHLGGAGARCDASVGRPNGTRPSRGLAARDLSWRLSREDRARQQRADRSALRSARLDHPRRPCGAPNAIAQAARHRLRRVTTLQRSSVKPTSVFCFITWRCSNATLPRSVGSPRHPTRQNTERFRMFSPVPGSL